MIVVDSDFSALEGTNCYCSDESAAQIRQAISGLPLCAVHRIGTGDYHYVSLFWLERVTEPFTLILFDNHPDDQPTAFSPDTLSCGSWVAEARKLPFCQDVIWIRQASVSRDFFQSERPLYPGRHVRESVAARGHVNGGTAGAAGGGMSEAKIRRTCLPEIREPLWPNKVYLSIDLDVLSEEYARTDWDQGTMTLEELVKAIEEIKASSHILGVDICGGLTPQRGATDDDLALNSRTETSIISVFRD